jgi:hypothetical protein
LRSPNIQEVLQWVEAWSKDGGIHTILDFRFWILDCEMFDQVVVPKIEIMQV